jgi:hypothetical protein
MDTVVTLAQTNEYIMSKNINDELSIQLITKGVEAINKMQEWEWVKTAQPSKGFSFTEDPRVDEFVNLSGSDHSGFTVAYTLRSLQQLAVLVLSDKKHITCAKE